MEKSERDKAAIAFRDGIKALMKEHGVYRFKAEFNIYRRGEKELKTLSTQYSMMGPGLQVVQLAYPVTTLKEQWSE